ncbi:MAG: hypothetical protein HYY16_02505 [Planctomycetes bacterium]|nr:hypothetical protein [Planctomycetota bacterium]
MRLHAPGSLFLVFLAAGQAPAQEEEPRWLGSYENSPELRQPSTGSLARLTLNATPSDGSAVEDAVLERLVHSRISSYGWSGTVMILRSDAGDKAVFRAYDGTGDLAAYRVNRLLRLGMVPPTAPYAFKDVPYRTVRGTVQLFIDGVQGSFLSSVNGPPWSSEAVTPLNAANARIFDYLIGMDDRHGGNWLLANGPSGAQRLILFDHTGVVIEKTAGLSEPLALEGIQTIGRSFYERLKTVSTNDLREAASPLRKAGRTKRDVESLVRKRDLVLERIDHLIRRHGEARVLIEDAPRPAKPEATPVWRAAGGHLAYGSANFAGAYLLKESTFALLSWDADRVKRGSLAVIHPDFWKSYGVFTAGSLGADLLLRPFGSKALSPFVVRSARAWLPLGAGVLATQLASGRVSGKELLVSTSTFLTLGLAIDLMVPWVPAGRVARFALRTAKLAAVLAGAELLDRGFPRHGLRQQMEDAFIRTAGIERP